MNYLWCFSDGRRYFVDDFPMCPSIGSVIMAGDINYVVTGYDNWRDYFDHFDNMDFADDEYLFAVILEPTEKILSNDTIIRDIKINTIID